MNEKEKEEQLKPKGADDLDVETEADIFFPEVETVTIRDRTYRIEALKLRQMRLLLRLSKIDITKMDETLIDKMTEGIGEIIGEPDLEWLEKSLDLRIVKEIFTKVRKQTYAGIPARVKGAQPGQ